MTNQVRHSLGRVNMELRVECEVRYSQMTSGFKGQLGHLNCHRWHGFIARMRSLGGAADR